MKYIRTENGISKLDAQDDRLTNQINVCDGGWGYRGEAPIRVADTIEELCDEFVGVDKTCENEHQLLRAIPYKCANFWNGGVYGAIWTSKGLIYVAKMDNEGKLVLI